MNRRSFLTRSGLALGALIVGDEVLEAMERLTHTRTSFPSAAIHRPTLIDLVRAQGDSKKIELIRLFMRANEAMFVPLTFRMPS